LSSRPDARPAPGVDFFRYGALPVPLVTVEEAERLAATSFGLKVRARPLGADTSCLRTRRQHVRAWDLRHAYRVVGRLAEHVRDRDTLELVTEETMATCCCIL